MGVITKLFPSVSKDNGLPEPSTAKADSKSELEIHNPRNPDCYVDTRGGDYTELCTKLIGCRVFNFVQ